MKPGRRRSLAALVVAPFVVAAPLARAAAPARVRRLGVLGSREEAAAVARRLAPLGFTEAVNLRVEVRDATDDPAQLARAAAELVRARPDVLLAWNRVVLQALRDATTTIPIMCAGVADPVGYGFARSLRRPIAWGAWRQ